MFLIIAPAFPTTTYADAVGLGPRTGHAASGPASIYPSEPTYWREGGLIGVALTAILLWSSGWIELPGAVILVPLGGLVGALVGGQFPK